MEDLAVMLSRAIAVLAWLLLLGLFCLAGGIFLWTSGT